MKDLWYTFLGKAFSLFAQVMVKVQPIWEQYKAVISLVIGLALGLILAWGPFVAKWENASPGTLRADYRSHYLASVAEDYVQTGNVDKVIRTLGLDLPKSRHIPWTAKKGTLPKDINTAIEGAAQFGLTTDEVIHLQRLAQDIDQIRSLTETVSEEPESQGGSTLKTVGILIALLLAVVLLVALVFIWLNKKRSLPEPETEVYETVQREPAATSSATGVAEPGEPGEPPVKSFTTTYVLGDDYFDPSFSIEIGPDFLGECGIGISETIGAGDPKKVTAFEAWLFDKSDIRTVTSVLASEYAANDPDLRAKLEPKGDVEPLAVGMEVTLETTALRVQARVLELEYAQGNLPTHSFIQKISFELQAWVKATE